MSILFKPNLNQNVDDENGDTFKSFVTYTTYLKCISKYLDQKYKDWNYFYSECKKTCSKFKKLKCFNNDIELEKYLRLCWNTEIIVEHPYKDINFIRMNNAWKPIQVYYSIYSLCEALCLIENSKIAGSHSEALKIITSILLNLKLSPWDLAFVGKPGKKDRDHKPNKNFPSNLEFPSNLSINSTNYIGMIGSCLKAEHKNRKKDIWDKKKYKQKEKRNFKYKYEIDPKPTTLLHFLHRLRIKANYKEIDCFIYKGTDDEIKTFAENLEKFCFWTITLLEHLIICRIGKDVFKSILEKYSEEVQLSNNIEKRFKKLY